VTSHTTTAPSDGRLGAVGVRAAHLHGSDRGLIADAAAECEELGYGAIWIPAARPEVLEGDLRALLAATRSLVAVTSVASIWTHPASSAAALHARLTAEYPGRFLLGIGVSHDVLVNRAPGQAYERPFSAMRRYLDALDAGGVPRQERVLAALAPKMLGLARDRAAGSHPFVSVPEHTAWARGLLGEGPLLAPDVKMVLETDATRARAAAREAVGFHLTLPNYVANVVRSGFSEADALGGGSDRLIDRIVAWGDLDAVRARLDEHRRAGADHIVIDPVPPAGGSPRELWRRLAPRA
jgi:probable F420-dependent oxidoreductase